MHAHNLRFGAATTDRQIEIYTQLVPALRATRDQANAERVTPSNPDRTGESLRSAAKQAFKWMRWDQLEAHLRNL
jgi:hypothetical protein